MTRLRKRMLGELQRRNYAPTTIRAYLYAVDEFAQLCRIAHSASIRLVGQFNVRTGLSGRRGVRALNGVRPPQVRY